ncbi:MAG: hypothetical protein GY749_49065 [Desulfobacteraceae bacterium]|nr:hypothetical protein [Desulfobacteraceae bacterium]
MNDETYQKFCLSSNDGLTTSKGKNNLFLFPSLRMEKTPFFQILMAVCLCFVIIGTLTSCGMKIRTRAFLGGRLHIKVEISEKANQNSPTPLDLIVVYNEKLMERLLKITSKEWFEQREQIKRDYIEGTGLDYWGWEWIPGQRIPTQKLPLKPKAKGGLIFADYLAPGTHRFRVDPFKDITIRLLEKNFLVESKK